jgi:hypothetical protein
MKYSDRSLFGKRTYELCEGSIFVRGTTTHGAKFEAKFEYSSLSSNPEKVWVRSPLLWAGMTVVCMAGLSLTGLAIFEAQDKEFLRWMAYAAVTIGLGLALVSLRPIELSRFKSHAGVPAFDVFRAGPMKDQFDSFTHEIEVQIVRHKMPNKAPEPTPGSVTPHADA